MGPVWLHDLDRALSISGGATATAEAAGNAQAPAANSSLDGASDADCLIRLDIFRPTAIAITGHISAGKSTLLRQLAERHGWSSVALSGVEIGLDPHLEGPIMPFRVTDDDRAEFLVIPPTEDLGIERNGFCQLSDILTVDRRVARQFG